MRKTVTILTIFFGVNSYAQSDLNNSTWISEKDVTLRFSDSSAFLTGINFISGYEMKGDTLHFFHDFSSVIEIREGGKIIPRRNFELPDSYFKVSIKNADTMVLTAINPTAVHLVNKLTRNFSYHLDDKEAIHWEKSGKKPEKLSSWTDTSLVFWNIRTITKVRAINKVSLSTVAYGWTGIHYTDITFDSTLRYTCRIINQEYEDKNKCEFFYYTGNIDSLEYFKIRELYGQTNLPDSGKISYNYVYASHDENFILEIEHNFGITTMEGNRASLPDYVRTFFDSIYREFPKEQSKTAVLKSAFPLSRFKDN